MRGLVGQAANRTLRLTGAVVRGSVGATVGLVREVSSAVPITRRVERRIEAVRSGLVHVVESGALDGPDPGAGPAATRGERDRTSLRDLRATGDALLHRPPDRVADEEHPAFARMLRELVPDEARLLRHMALTGPQPTIDVRTRTGLGGRSELVARGINVVAETAGCARPDRDQEYLANLVRLALIHFCDRAVEDARCYPPLEAHPAARAALTLARKATTVHRSICLTPFGTRFCDACFTLDGTGRS